MNRLHSIGSSRDNQMVTLQDKLDYNAMSVGPSGAVLDRAEKERMRDRLGFCLECEGRPVKLYIVKKSPFNPFWVRKETITEPGGKCREGRCLVCHPIGDLKNRRLRTPAQDRVRRESNTSTGNQDGRNSGHMNRPRRSDASNSLSNAHHNSSLRSMGSLTTPPSSTPDQSRNVINARVEHSPMRSPALSAITAVAPLLQPPPMPLSHRQSGEQSIATPQNKNTATSTSTMAPMSPRQREERSSVPSNNVNPFPGVFVPEHPTSPEAGSVHVEADEMLRRLLEDAGDDDDLATIFTMTADPQMSPGVAESLSLSSSSNGGASNQQGDIMQDHLCMPPIRSRSRRPGAEDGDPGTDQPMRSGVNNRDLSTTVNSEIGNGSSPALAPAPPLSAPRLPQRENEPSVVPADILHVPPGDDLVAEFASSDAPEQEQAPTPSTSSASSSEDEMNESQLVAIQRLLREIPNDQTALMSEVLLIAMREPTTGEEVHLVCLRKIRNLCQDNEPNTTTFLNAGAPDDITRVMKGFPASAEIQESGCSLLWTFGITETTRPALVWAGACDQLLQALDDHIENVSVVRAAIEALRTLSPEREARERLIALGCPSITARAMVMNRRSAPIQRDACAVLSNCAVNIEKNVASIVPFYEMDAILQSISAHQHDNSVVTGACFALYNLTFEKLNCRMLRQCQGVDELLEHASTFVRSQTAPGHASEMIERLQVSRAEDESVEEVGLANVSNYDGGTPEVLRNIVDFMTGYEWSVRLVRVSMGHIRQICAQYPYQSRRIIEGGDLLQSIVVMLNQHMQNAEIVEEGLQLISDLCQDDAILRQAQTTLIAAGAADLIFKALVRYGPQQNVVDAALAALSPLSSVEDCWNNGEEGDRPRIVQDAIRAHSDRESIAFNGAGIISNLDILQRL